MAFNIIDLPTLFSQNWGLSVKMPAGKVEITDHDGSKNVRQTGSGALDGYNVEDKNIVNKKSRAGNYGEYYKPDKRGTYVFMPLTLGNLFLPYCWISFNAKKRIVETPLTERRGVVREYISTEDYTFSVKGFIVGHDGMFPEKDVEELRNLFERNEAVECKSVFTDIFLLSKEQGGQDKVVIYDLSITDNQGIEHVRGYSFEIKADQEFELELLD